MPKRAHPIQPLEFDEHSVLRFKANAIVQHILDKGGIDMNQITVLPFSREDREQFAQLIGYSHSGAYDLDYMSSEVLDAAKHQFDSETPELESRNKHLREMIDSVKDKLRDGIGELYGVGPDFDDI